MPKWIVKQVDRVPRYVVEASSMELVGDMGDAVAFLNAEGAIEAIITEVAYVKPDDTNDITAVTVYDEE